MAEKGVVDMEADIFRWRKIIGHTLHNIEAGPSQKRIKFLARVSILLENILSALALPKPSLQFFQSIRNQKPTGILDGDRNKKKAVIL